VGCDCYSDDNGDTYYNRKTQSDPSPLSTSSSAVVQTYGYNKRWTFILIVALVVVFVMEVYAIIALWLAPTTSTFGFF
jgi:hypothetical protein